MGFLEKALDEQAIAANAAQKLGTTFMCVRCDQVTDDASGLASSLCGTCRTTVAAARLYSVELIWALLMATGPFTAGTLAALNWKRLGNSRKALSLVIEMLALTVGVLFIGPAVFLPPVLAGGLIIALCWVALTAAFIAGATTGLGPVLTAHRTIAGKRGNAFVPVCIAVALAIPASVLWFRVINAQFHIM